jgi:hypothetical protein
MDHLHATTPERNAISHSPQRRDATAAAFIYCIIELWRYTFLPARWISLWLPPNKSNNEKIHTHDGRKRERKNEEKKERDLERTMEGISCMDIICINQRALIIGRPKSIERRVSCERKRPASTAAHFFPSLFSYIYARNPHPFFLLPQCKFKVKCGRASYRDAVARSRMCRSV